MNSRQKQAFFFASALAITLNFTSSGASAQVTPGEVDRWLFLGDGVGGFTGELDDKDALGTGVASPGDLNGDGVPDLALGAPDDDDGGNDRGAVWILFLTPTGEVGSTAKISDLGGGLEGQLENNDGFGSGLASLGDLDGNGVGDLIVGSLGDGVGGNNRGAVWVLFMEADGSASSFVRISDFEGGFFGELKANDGFGRGVANLGDVDGDGVVDVAVSADNDSTVANGQGAVWILFMQADGFVKGFAKITQDSFPGVLDMHDGFGSGVAGLGDLNGDGTPDLAAGVSGDDDGGQDAGAVWLLFLMPDGSVMGQAKISATNGVPGIEPGDNFGSAVALLEDLDEDGVRELAVGAPRADGFTGATWIVFVDAAGSVRDALEQSSTAGSFDAPLATDDKFGRALGSLPDLDGDGFPELLAGAPGDDGQGTARGGVYIIFLQDFADVLQPYNGPIGSAEGRPGRVGFATRDLPDQDFIGGGVIVIPQSDGDLVRNRGITPDADNQTFEDVGVSSVGEGPAQANSGNFNSLAAFSIGTTLTFPDVVTANRGGDSVSLLIGNNDGTFQPQVEVPLSFDIRPHSIQVGDLNGDTLDDVVVAGADGVTVLLGDGLAGFNAEFFTPVAFPTDLALGFVDGDANLDVVVGQGTVAMGPGLESGGFTTLLGNGDGTLTPAPEVPTPWTVASVLLGELTGDTNLDLLVVNHQFDAGPGGIPQGLISLYEGDGLGGWTPCVLCAPPLPFPDAGGIHPLYGALADVDGDLDLDAVYSSGDSLAFAPGTFQGTHPPIEVTILLNDGTGGLTVQDLGTAYAGKGVSVVLEDFSPQGGDGLLDAVLVWFDDVAAGTEQEDPDFQTFLALFTGDGSPEVFADPTPTQFAVGAGAGDGILAEVNGDPLLGDGLGALDLLVPNRDDNSISLLLGDGAGGFTTGPTVQGVDVTNVESLPPGDWVGGPRALEFGGTEVIDGIAVFGFALVSYNAWEDRSENPDPNPFASLTLLAGGLTGTFARLQQVFLDRGGEFTQVDVDGDGNTDIAVTQRIGPGIVPQAAGVLGDTLHVYPGLGPTQAKVDEAPLVVPGPAGHVLTGGLVAVDLDGDEAPELVSTSYDGEVDLGHVVVWPNVEGLLDPPTVYAMGTSWDEVRSLELADLDGDEAPDLALGLADGRLVVARNQGGGAFAPTPVFASAAAVGGGAVSVGEVTGDGVLDAVSSNGAGADAMGQAFVRTLEGTGGNFEQVQTVGGLASVDAEGNPLQPLLGDLDNDGTTEMVLVHGTAGSVSVLPNQFDTFETFGSAKPGTGGAFPILGGLGYTVSGAEAAVQLQGGLGGAPALLIAGFGRTEQLFPAVGSIVLQKIVTLGGTPGAAGEGDFTLPFVMPGGADILGLEVTAQFLVLDPGAGGPDPFGFSISNGLAFTIVK